MWSEDVERRCVRDDQFGYWLKVGTRKITSLGNRKEGLNQVSATNLSMRGTGVKVSIGQRGEDREASAILKVRAEVQGELSNSGDKRVLRLGKTVDIGGVDACIGEGGIQQQHTSREAISEGGEGCRVSSSCLLVDMMHMKGEESVRKEIVTFGPITQAERMEVNTLPVATRLPLLECTNTRPGIGKEE